MKLCLRCNQYFEDASAQCPTDGSSLEVVGDHPLIGALINDRYVVDSVIGKGSSGIVYKATRLLMQREVAVKVLHSYLGAESGALDRFLREARAASRLRHPHIINIWESGVTDDGQPYFVMDYLEGVTIAQLIKDRGYLHPSRALTIIKQICEALTEAHNQSIVHRDIKPENIVLQESDYEKGEDFVKVLDFGIADQPAGNGSKAKQRTAAGSPAYMSPEQCQGFELDFRSDVYSLGVVVFEMLTGVRPFSAQEVMQLFHMHVKQPPPTMGSMRPDLNFPEKLEAAVAKALSKKPEQRQQSIKEFGNELEEACRGFDFGAEKAAAETVSASRAYVPEDNSNSTATGTGSHNFLDGAEFLASERLTANMREAEESDFSVPNENSLAGGSSSSANPALPTRPGIGDAPKKVPAAFSYSRSRGTGTGASVVRNPLDAGDSLMSPKKNDDSAQPPARPSQSPVTPPVSRLNSDVDAVPPTGSGVGAPSGNGQTSSDKELDVERALKSAKRASESFKEILASGDHAPFIANDESSLTPNTAQDDLAMTPPPAPPEDVVSSTSLDAQLERETERALLGGDVSETEEVELPKPKNDVSKWAQKVLGAGKGSSANITPIGTPSSSSIEPVAPPVEHSEFFAPSESFEVPESTVAPTPSSDVAELKERELERSKQIAEAANHLMESYKSQPDLGTTSGSFDSAQQDFAPLSEAIVEAPEPTVYDEPAQEVEAAPGNEFASDVERLIEQSTASADHEAANFIETASQERRRFEDPVGHAVEAENSFASEVEQKINDAIIHTGDHSLSGNHPPFAAKETVERHDIVISGNNFAAADEVVEAPHAETEIETSASSHENFGSEEDSEAAVPQAAPLFSASNFDPRRFEEPVHKSDEEDNEFASEVEKRLDSAIMKPEVVRRMGDDTGMLSALGRNQVEQFAKESAAATPSKKPSETGSSKKKKEMAAEAANFSKATAKSEDLVMSKSSIDVPPSDIEENSSTDFVSSNEEHALSDASGLNGAVAADSETSLPSRPSSYTDGGFEFEKEDPNAPLPVEQSAEDSHPIEDVEIVDIDAQMESELDAQQAAFEAVMSSSGSTFGSSNIIEDAQEFGQAPLTESDVVPTEIPTNVFEEPNSSPFVSDAVEQEEASPEQSSVEQQPESAPPLNERPTAADLARAFLSRSGKGQKDVEEPVSNNVVASAESDEAAHAEEIRAAEIASAEAEAKRAAILKSEQEAQAAEEEARAEEARLAEVKAAAEAKEREEAEAAALAQRQAAEEQAKAEKKAAEEKAAVEAKAAAEQKAADEKAAADKKLAEENKASDDAKAAEAAKAKEETAKRYDQPISERKPAAPFDLKAELAERLKASKITGNTDALPPTPAMMADRLTESPAADASDASVSASKAQDKPGPADAVSRLIEAAKRSEGKAQADSVSSASSSTIARQPDALNKKIESVKMKIEALKSGATPPVATSSTASSASNVKLPGEATGSKVNASAIPDVNSVAGSRKRMLEAAQKAVETGTVNRMPAIRNTSNFPDPPKPSESSTAMKAEQGLASVEAKMMRSSTTNSKLPGNEGQNPADLAAQLVTQALKKKGQQIDPAGDPPSEYHSSNFRNVADTVKTERAKAATANKKGVSSARGYQGGPNTLAIVGTTVLVIGLIGAAYWGYTTYLVHPANPTKDAAVPANMTVDQMLAANKLEAAEAALDKVHKAGKIGPKDSDRCIKLAKKFADAEKFDDAIEILSWVPRRGSNYRTAQKLLKNYKVIKSNVSGQ